MEPLIADRIACIKHQQETVQETLLCVCHVAWASTAWTHVTLVQKKKCHTGTDRKIKWK